MKGHAASATLHKPAAEFLGLPAGLPIAAGAGDAAASAIGIGAINDGDGFISLGTSAQYFVTTKSFRPRPTQMIQALGHGLPDLWYQVAALLNGASPLTWLNEVMRGGNIQTLLQRTQRRYRGPGRILFLPYLSGERTPHNDPSARAAFHGLHAGTTQEDLALAVLEGVALSLADCQDVLEQSGTRVAELLVVGGGTRSTFWMQLLANVLNRRITIPKGSDVGAAFGAARLARLSVTGEAIAEVCSKPKALVASGARSKTFQSLCGSARRFPCALRRIERNWQCIARRGPGAHSTFWMKALGFKVKRIAVNPGGRLSLQSHKHRGEHWTVVTGIATVTVGDKVQDLSRSQHIDIPKRRQAPARKSYRTAWWKSSRCSSATISAKMTSSAMMMFTTGHEQPHRHRPRRHKD